MWTDGKQKQVKTSHPCGPVCNVPQMNTWNRMPFIVTVPVQWNYKSHNCTQVKLKCKQSTRYYKHTVKKRSNTSIINSSNKITNDVTVLWVQSSDSPGEEAVCNLFVLLFMLLYHLSEGNKVNHEWLGWEESCMIFLALLRHWEWEMYSREGRVSCPTPSAELSCQIQCSWNTTQLMQYATTLSMAEWYEATRSFSFSSTFWSSLRKCNHCLDFLTTAWSVSCPGKVLWDVGPQELKGGDPLHKVSVDVKWGWIHSVLLFCFVGVERQIVSGPPLRQPLHLQPRCITSKFNDCLAGAVKCTEHIGVGSVHSPGGSRYWVWGLRSSKSHLTHSSFKWIETEKCPKSP